MPERSTKLTKAEARKVGHLVALAAGRIGRELQRAKTSPRALLDNHAELQALAEIAHWLDAGYEKGALTGRGVVRLIRMREAAGVAFHNHWPSGQPPEDALAEHDKTLDMFDRAVARSQTDA